MYKIIGGDQKVYGPITADQVRQWFSEGRVKADTSILPEGATVWTTLSALPEFADLFVSPAAVPGLEPGGQQAPLPPDAILGRDYSIDIGDCISRGWALVKANFWPTVGISTLIWVIVSVANQVPSLFTRPIIDNMIHNHSVSPQGVLIVVVVSLLFAPVYTILSAGLLKYYLKLIRGENATVADAFSGFKCVAQLALLGWVMSLFVWIGICFCLLPGIYLSVAWYFAVPLVVDRGMGFWDAMELSRKMVNKHWFIVFALMLVLGLVGMAGIIACCIGILVTMTIASVALMYAYEDIFSHPTA